MDPLSWGALVTAFVLGAMSPGPSLALVLRNTLSGGQRCGVLTALGHGIGFGVYALLVAFGIASVLLAHQLAYAILCWIGIAWLIYLGSLLLWRSRSARLEPSTHDDIDNRRAQRRSTLQPSGFVQGLSLAILNPKILAWMLAIYAPFITAGIGAAELLAMGLTGMLIDGGWYCSVALLLTANSYVTQRLRQLLHRIDAAMGCLMLGFAIKLLNDQIS